jgi:Flp pilus assembly protein TadG
VSGTEAAERRGRGDRGAVVVEFALVLPVLMMLLLGVVSGATAWNQSQSLGQGSRVAGRYAATLPVPAAAEDQEEWLDDVMDRAVAAAAGTVDDGVVGRAVCVAFVDPQGTSPDATFSRRMNAAGVRTTGTTECFDDGQGDDTTRVQVVLERDGLLDFGLHRRSLELERSVVYAFEADGGL